MWLPKTEKEIIEVVNSGSLNETSNFDAKKEISTKSQEIAKDIASMANDGGVIIYGIGEDENKRLTILNPISLAGQPERIDAIVRSSIAEPPQIHITTIPTVNNISVGYLIILIPPSERAPHMVIVNGDHRFYGRTATGNAPLNEGEVARLYARREKTEIDRDQLLENEIEKSPLEPNGNFAYLYLFAKPVLSKEGFFDSLVIKGKKLHEVINEVILQSGNREPKILNQMATDFIPPHIWKQRVDGLLGKMDYESNNVERIPASTLDLNIDYNGFCHLIYGRAGERISENGPITIFAENIASLTYRFIASISALYDLAGHIGLVDLGLAITGIKESIVFTQNWLLQSRLSPFYQDFYKKTGCFSNLLILDNPESIAEYLVLPFINAISQNQINPFSKN
jgi:hypothetical protein